MNVKFKCSKCNKEVKSLSVVVNMLFRKDLTTVNTKHNSEPCLVEFDREYLCSSVKSIIYSGCDCKEVEVVDPKIIDFIREGGYISIRDLKHNKYGTLKVVKEIKRR